MWESILKRKKKLDWGLLKEISIESAEQFKGKLLDRDEFLDFVKTIKNIYTTTHQRRIRGGMDEGFIQAVTQILKNSGILEVKRKKFRQKEVITEKKFYLFKE